MELEPFREQFSLPKMQYHHLNHAGVSPISKRCADAMRDVIQWNEEVTGENWIQIVNAMNQCRDSVAHMLNVSTDEIALSRNTTEGINWVANGIDWNHGDQVVSVMGEYPANVYPWMRLEQKGVKFKMLQPVDQRIPLEIIEKELTPDTRLLTISYVQFASGYRSDLQAIGKLCHDKGILFLVDLIQGMGVFPLDMKAWNVTFACGGSQKWLLGPQGAGFFYCDKDYLNDLEVTCVGASSVANWIPYTDYDFTLSQKADRFEYGTPPMIPLAGLGAAIDLLLDAELKNVADRVRVLTDLLVDGATQKGYKCRSPREKNEWSGIVVFEHPSQAPQSIVNQLKAKNILAAEREGYLRLAPHFYQTEDEMKFVVDAM